MQEHSRYAVGIDIGTAKIRCVVGHIDPMTGTPSVVGVGEAANTGMRKGTIANLAGPAQAIDEALGEAERMSGYQVDAATVSINGTHIFSTHADGMIAVSNPDREIHEEDLRRIEEVATLGKIPANREVLEVVPHAYRLDGQDNIKDPIGMTGTRLEISANVVSVLGPHLANLQRAAEMAKVTPNGVVVAGLAAARAVLSEQQMENGVALVDIGGATTTVAVYEEGDLQYVSVLPVGGVNITNDLAIGLKTDPEIAEKVKIAHATLTPRTNHEGISIKHDKEIFTFSSTDIDEIVEARLEEVFETVNYELKKAGRAGKLPNGIVLTGGTAKLSGIAEFAKKQLGLAARTGKPSGFGGVAEHIEEPQYATAVGLMLYDGVSAGTSANTRGHAHLPSVSLNQAKGVVNKFFGRFKA